MLVTPQRLPEVVLVAPRLFADARGYLLEAYSAERYRAAGLPAAFVQDNLSSSRRGVVRGLHYQHPDAQGKLVMVLEGEVFDVAVDVRRGSPTFGQWVAVTLAAGTHQQIYVPPGFAHGFCATTDRTLVSYKCTSLYDAASQVTVAFSDPDLAIPWPVPSPVLSEKDASALPLRDIPSERLPPWGG